MTVWTPRAGKRSPVCTNTPNHHQGDASPPRGTRAPVPPPGHLRAGAGCGTTHGWLRSNRRRCLICLFHVYSWRTLTEGYGSIRELSAGGLIVRISEARSNETHWGCLMLPILMHASEMNKASSRGKNNNNKRMKRSRRNQGGAQCAIPGLANAQLLRRCPPSTWVLSSVPKHRSRQPQMGERNVLLSKRKTPKHLRSQRLRDTLRHQSFPYHLPALFQLRHFGQTPNLQPSKMEQFTALC